MGVENEGGRTVGPSIYLKKEILPDYQKNKLPGKLLGKIKGI